MAEDQRKYDRLAEILKEKHIKTFMAEGKDEKTATRLAEKKAIEGRALCAAQLLRNADGYDNERPLA